MGLHDKEKDAEFGPTDPLDCIERLANMRRDEVDELPYGFIVLDDKGVVLLYNRYEAQMSRLPPERVVDRNFFFDIAPCTRVEAFYGRFRALVEDPRRTVDRFAFRFHFLHGAQDVLVQFARAPGEFPVAARDTPLTKGNQGKGSCRILMTVMRRMLPHASTHEPSTLHLDESVGRALGPLGPVFPLRVELFLQMLERFSDAEVRLFGQELGRPLAEAAAKDAQHASSDFGELSLREAPSQIAAGALDKVLAASGLGRVAFDFTQQATTGLIGCLLRPSFAIGTRQLALLYEGLLECALGMSFDVDLVVRCLDARSPSTLPWRFAVAPRASADAIEARLGEESEDVARRLGLLLLDP